MADVRDQNGRLINQPNRSVSDPNYTSSYLSGIPTKTNYSGGGGGGGGAAPAPAAPAYDATAAYYAQLQAAAQKAYDENMAALNKAFKDRKKLLGENYQSTLDDMQGTYDTNSGVVNQNADRSLKDAYVNMMINKRDMPSMLSAQGISGGPSESALAGIRTQYGNARGDLEQSRGDAIEQLLLALQNNQGEASRAYNQQLSDDSLTRLNYEMQIKQALQDAMTGIISKQINAAFSGAPSTYTTSLNNASSGYSSQAGGIGSSTASLAAANTPQLISLMQSAGSGGSGGDWWEEYLKKLRGETGMTA